MDYSSTEIQNRKKSTDMFVQNIGKSLWHYTSFPALDGILGKKEIWFGSVTNVNDKLEVGGFINNLKQRIQEYIKQNSITPKCNLDDIFHRIDSRIDQKHLFMFCLSQALNDAAQWDRYADYGRGVAIEFNTEALHNLLYYHGVTMGKQYYTQETRDHELYKLLSSYIKTGNLGGFSNLDGFIDNLVLCGFVHKHPSFVSEKEVRIAPYFVMDDDPHISYKTFNIIKEVYVLNLNKLLEEEKMKMEDIISSIIIGPRSLQNKKDLENYCRHLGYDKLAQNITISDCPLR